MLHEAGLAGVIRTGFSDGIAQCVTATRSGAYGRVMSHRPPPVLHRAPPASLLLAA